MQDMTTTDVIERTRRRNRQNNERTFADIVSDDVRGEGTADDAEMLRRSENLDAFYGALVDMLSSFDMQLSKQRIESMEQRAELLAAGKHTEWHEYHLRVMRWRRSIQRLRRMTEAKIREVRSLRRGRLPAANAQPLLDCAAALYHAIEIHRRAYRSKDATDEELDRADEMLWQCLTIPVVQQTQNLFGQVAK